MDGELPPIGTTKVYCCLCDGAKYVTELEYPSRKEVKVKCPNCKGEGWVMV